MGEPAIWILLFVASWLAATVSGAAGFGGALLLLPILANTIGTTSAVPVLTIAQLLGNLSRMGFGWPEIRWRPVGLFVLGAIPASIGGARVFVGLPAGAASTAIGVLLLAVVLARRCGMMQAPGLWFIAAGALVGFLSALAGSAGPLGAAFFLNLSLSPVAYVASEAATAVAMHTTKTIVYHRYLDLGSREVLQGVFLGVAMILGSWTGKRIIKHIPREQFTVFVEVLLLVSAVQLIVTAWW